MSIACSTYSRGLPAEGNQSWRAARSPAAMAGGERMRSIPDDEGVSPAKANPHWPRYANTVVANLPEMVKPATSGGEMSTCTRRATRGGTGGRAPKDRSGTCGGPVWSPGQQSSKRWGAVALSSRVRRKGRERKCGNTPSRARGPRHCLWGIHNPAGGHSRESERPIRALKRGNARGAKGSYFSHASVKGGQAA